jgi:hypothetical protein
MNYELTALQALNWVTRLMAICVLIDTLETLYNLALFRTGGLYDWFWLRQHPRFVRQRPILKRITDALFNYRTWISLLCLRGIAAFILLCDTPPQYVCLWIMFFVGGLANIRALPLKTDTPNRFTLMIIGALILYSFNPTHLVAEACLWFLFLQTSLTYLSAGFFKLKDKDWRTGIGLLSVFNAPFWFDTSKLAAFFYEYPILCRFLSYSIIGFECLFSLVLFCPMPYAFIFIVFGLFFHLSIALLLGLNKFFWAWIATYPAVIYLIQK